MTINGIYCKGSEQNLNSIKTTRSPMVKPNMETKDTGSETVGNGTSNTVASDKERKHRQDSGVQNKRGANAKNESLPAHKRRANGGSYSANKKDRDKKIPAGKSTSVSSKANTDLHDNTTNQPNTNVQTKISEANDTNSSTDNTTPTVHAGTVLESKSHENNDAKVEDKFNSENSGRQSGNPTSVSRSNSVDKNIHRLQRRNSKTLLSKPVHQSDSKGKLLNIKKSWQKLKTAKIIDQALQNRGPNGSIAKQSPTITENSTKDNSEGNSKSPNECNSKNEQGSDQQKDKTLPAQVLSVPVGVPSRRDPTTVESESDQKALLPRDSTQVSLDATSQISFDPVIQTTAVRYPQEEKPRSVVSNNDSWIRSAIPFLPIGLSVACLILNILIPGSGTVLSGFSILCCGRTRVQTKDDQVMVTLCVNVCVGVSQLFTVTFLLVGWFWSLAWGIKLVSLSVEYKLQRKQMRERELQTLALSAFGSPIHVRPHFSLV